METSNIYFPLAESLPKDDYVIATYIGKTPENKSSLMYAIEVAIDQTTGTWTPVPEETQEVKRNHRARVIGVYDIPVDNPFEESTPNSTTTLFQIAFPHVNFGASLAMLFTTIMGNNSSMGFIKLVDLTFPEKYIANFQGPKFGIKGLRKLLNVPQRPLLTNMIKPCTGIAPKIGAELAKKAALGGADFIKDDELLAEASFSTISERVHQFMNNLKEADEVKGEKTIYLLNITDHPNKMVDHALRAIEAGVNGLMINYLATGFDTVRMITEHKDIQVPVLGHCAMSGIYSMANWSGVDVRLLISKLPRLMGLDIALIYMPGGRFFLTKEDYASAANMMRQDFYNLRSTFPMPGGSIHPGIVDDIVAMTGKDCVISAGGGIHGHPMGSVAGAKAMRQAIDLAMMEKEEAAEKRKEYKEFQSAVQTWGEKL
jgi:2,3-diketo-5-methylthiopentyl-1-phosphate enolase